MHLKVNHKILISLMHKCIFPRVDPCRGIKCKFYSQCTVFGNGTAACVCPSFCGRVHAPVCGSNGKTYANECLMKVESCLTQKLVTIVHAGNCGKYLLH